MGASSTRRGRPVRRCDRENGYNSLVAKLRLLVQTTRRVAGAYRGQETTPREPWLSRQATESSGRQMAIFKAMVGCCAWQSCSDLATFEVTLWEEEVGYYSNHSARPIQ